MADRGIFIAEFDDDYQRAANLSKADLQRRLRCYFLLAPSLLIHPAYIWQAPTTHALVTREMTDLLAPPHAKLSLGDSPDLGEYMQQRIGNLSARNVKQVTNELVQYTRWGASLQDQAAKLDERFGTDSRIALESSRDKMFRGLLIRDLSPTAVAGASLRELIRGYYMGQGNPRRTSTMLSALRSFVNSAPLVSLDSITAYLTSRNLGDLVQSSAFYNRLLVLYYRANVDGNYVVAGLPTLDPDDPTIHPYDPALFWSVVRHVFGEKAVDLLADDNSPEARDFLLRLKQDPDWRDFSNQYSDLRQGMDETLKTEATEIAKDLEISTGYARLKLLPRIWREQKKELITTILGLGFSAPIAPGPIILTAGSAATSVAGGVLTLRPLRRFRDEYEQNSLRRLKTLIRRQIRLLTRK
jgi:hypothetical protein